MTRQLHDFDRMFSYSVRFGQPFPRYVWGLSYSSPSFIARKHLLPCQGSYAISFTEGREPRHARRPGNGIGSGSHLFVRKSLVRMSEIFLHSLVWEEQSAGECGGWGQEIGQRWVLSGCPPTAPSHSPGQMTKGTTKNQLQS